MAAHVESVCSGGASEENHDDSPKSIHLMHPPLDSSFRCTRPTRSFTTARGETVPSLSIQSYIPVGCLRLHRTDTSLSPDIWESHQSWSSFAQSEYPVDFGNEITLTKETQDAVSAGLRRYGYSPMRRDPCKLRWARMEFKVNARDSNYGQVRIFVLPDDVGRTHIPRSDSDLRKQLFSILNNLDISPDTFDGAWDPQSPVKYLGSSNRTEEEVCKELSLLHIFNHLPSPNPQPELVKDKRLSEAVLDLLENSVRGLQANLFSFQSRTAAMMLQREVQPSQQLDPRLKPLEDQTGATFYYNKISGEWLSHGRFIDGPRGGILGEHMGRGKTLICLALIMATRHHYSSFPVDYCESPVARPKVGSLMEMAAAATARSSLPWKTSFQELLEDTGDDYERCLEAIRSQASYYTIQHPLSQVSSRRHSPNNLRSRKIFRASTTIVVVPANLLEQWLNEIEKHTSGLNVLVMKDTKMKLPAAQALIKYDVILFSKLRLEKEFPESVNKWASPAGHRRDCSCGCDCSTPLLQVHFKRIITDEGHFIGNSGGRSASKLVQIMSILAFDYRWVVSGTPTQGLYGIEKSDQLDGRYNGGHLEATVADHKQQRKDVEKIGNIATSFLKAEPWTSESGSWARFNMQTRYGEQDSFSFGDPDCLRQIMEHLVLRTRAEDVDPEISLPQLHQKVMYVEASVQDAIQLNIFVLNIVTNAITSERKDADYFFHPKNRLTVNELVRNLSQATFIWSGWTVESVFFTLENAKECLIERKIPISDQDEILLREAVAVGETILKFICSYPGQRHLLTTPLHERMLSSGPDSIFESASATDEIPIFVRNDFPEDIRMAWALDRSASNPTLFGFTQLKALSDFAISQLWKPNPLDGLCNAGIKVMERHRESSLVKLAQPNSKERATPKSQPSPSNSKRPSKGAKRSVEDASNSTSSPLRAGGATVGGHVYPRKPRRHALKDSNSSMVSKLVSTIESPAGFSVEERDEPILKSAMKNAASTAQKLTMDPESKLASAHLESTASAKLTYLIARILSVKDEEKSIIFYEHEHVAYYLAQALEVIGVEHLIYAKAKSLSTALQSRWLRKFADEDSIRVILMDLGAGTFGLDMSSASRVFFVSPVFNPQVEAQAVKRAHRIGQTRPVYVETLVMKGTMEEKMVERRKQLSDGDFSGIKTVLDDEEMYEWVKNPTFLPLPDAGDCILSNIQKTETMAKLPVPHQIFGSLLQRSVDTGAGGTKEISAPEVRPEVADDAESPRKKKKTVGFGTAEDEAESCTSETATTASSGSQKKKKKTVGFA